MAKRKTKNTEAQDAAASMRRVAYGAKVEAMREGRMERAHTFADRRREANRKACRGKFSPAR